MGDAERMVLSLLDANGEAYGIELVRGSDGVLKRGTVYVLLSRMEDEGLVESRAEDAPHLAYPRWIYSLSEQGKRARSLQSPQVASRRPPRMCPA